MGLLVVNPRTTSAFKQLLLHKAIHYPPDRQHNAATTHTVMLGYKIQKAEDSKGSQQSEEMHMQEKSSSPNQGCFQAEISRFLPDKRLAGSSLVTRTTACLSCSLP